MHRKRNDLENHPLMDHLPSINENSFPPPKILSLCSPSEYDGKGILDFPERAGWKIDAEYGPIRTDNTKTSINSPAALLQLWLYFGPLHDIFKIGNLDFRWEDYVETVDHDFLVTSTPLRKHLDQLRASAGGMNEDLRYQHQQRVSDCLKVVFRFFLEYHPASFRPQKWKVSSVLSPDLCISIIVLAETLTNAAKQIWPLPSDSAPLSKMINYVSWNPLHDRLRERNWCPSEIKMLYQEVDKTGLLLASLVKRPFSQHLQHGRCSESECLALQTSDSDYETKHLESCPRDSSCKSIVIDQGHLARILFSGGIPILYMIPSSGTTALQVQVLNHDSHPLDFIAISHVWAHGLGNPHENALPSCQLHRLNDLCSRSSPEVGKQLACWIDTLCIPVAVPSARKLAIRRLASAFRRARKVLVLDADLQRSSKNCSRTELATRVIGSGWMRRLWTLQETVMAQAERTNAMKVDVWFREGALPLNSIGGKSIFSFYNTEDALSKLFSSIPQFMSRDHAFNSLTRALRYRTTSKKEDEALCVASILGFDQSQIEAIVVENTAEARMQKMYTLIGEVPASVLFNRSRKLRQDKGFFGWAPASLLGSSSGHYLDFFAGPAGRCDKHGLHVQFPGFIITNKTTILKRSPRPGTRSQIFLGDPVEEGEDSKHPKLKIGPEVMPDGGQQFWQLAVQFEEKIEKAERPAVIINPRSVSDSILVSVTGEAEGVLDATFIMKIYAQWWRDGAVLNRGTGKDWEQNFVGARELESGQWWCVR